MLYLYLAAGGVLGTLARFGAGTWVASWAGTSFPWGTLLINLVGSFVLGFAVRATAVVPISLELRGLITVGFCGAFTTFSTFTVAAVLLWRGRRRVAAVVHVLANTGCGLAAAALGLLIIGTI